MGQQSAIEWTESTWNPITGCTKISLGCQNCYAERMALRLKGKGSPNYRNGFKITSHQHMLNLPIKWKKSRMIFVNSMSDLFHEEVHLDFIQSVFKVMNDCPQHIFQVLTKRSERIVELNQFLSWTNNIWMGVTIEHEKYLHRMKHLKQTDAKIKFISFEPLLSSIPQIELDNIDWIIVGGESGPGSRTLNEEWVVNIKNQCLSHYIPFFFKQWGGVNKKKAGRLLNGKEWNQVPDSDCNTSRNLDDQYELENVKCQKPQVYIK